MATTAISKQQEQVITYIPLGETAEVHLTLSRVKQFLCIPTKSGKMPTDEQVVKYMMLCKAQSLNPWVNDAYLVGYDGKDGPQFSLITAHQSFLKRAEASPEFDGMESGVIVAAAGVITERQGDLLLNGETLVGAWARVHRRDRSVPSYDSLNLKTFDTGRSRWAADPAGMIVKCAEASALRKAFPSTLAAMYCREEMDREREHAASEPVADTRSKTARLEERLLIAQPPTPVERTEDAAEAMPVKSLFAECTAVLRDAGLAAEDYEGDDPNNPTSTVWRTPSGALIRLADGTPSEATLKWVRDKQAFNIVTTEDNAVQNVRDVLAKCKAK